MHPISKVNFGSLTGKIKVHYHNGSSVVTGYIVKQTATKKFVVTTDGVTTYKVKFISSSATPVAGEMTIYVYPVVNGVQSGSPEHAKEIDMNHVETFEGHRYIWNLTPVTTNGYAQLDVN